MQQYWIEGLFIPKKTRKGGKTPAVEPFAKAIWANSPAEALQLATAELNGGQWTDGPHLGQKTEEQRMRSLGAPELPGFGAPPLKRTASKKK
jgi:hypothetical protein